MGMIKLFYLAILVIVVFFIYSCSNSSNSVSSFNFDYVSYRILIPLYSYPSDPVYSPEYNKLLNFRYPTKVDIILNPDNGPGQSVDANFSMIIQQLKSKGYFLLGYIPTNYSNRNIDDVKRDVDKYENFYEVFDGYFFDEFSNDIQTLSYYSSIYNYVKLKNKAVYFNPGTVVPGDFYSICDKVVVAEVDLQSFYRDYSNYVVNPKDCFLIYGVGNSQFYQCLSFLKDIGAKCFYIIDEDPPSWFKVSPYLNIIF